MALGTGYLEALLGIVSYNDVEIPLSSGINFKGGLQAVYNQTTTRIDASLVNTPNAVAEQTEWDPAAEDSEALVALAEGHAAGFYLVGLNVSIVGTPSGGSVVPVVTWGADGEDGEETGSAIASGALRVMPPVLVYSGGTEPITAQFTSTVTGSGLEAIVRANAVRISL